VAVLSKGELQQIDGPQEIYDRPVNLFVASFIGSPAMNLVDTGLEARGGGFVAHVGDQEIELPARVAALRPALGGYGGKRVALGIRPEHLHEPGRDAAVARLRGTVLVSEALGAEQLVHVEIDAPPVVTQEVLEIAGDIDVAVVEELEAEAQARHTTFVARFDAASRAQSGDAVEAAFAPEKAHFFDLETGKAIYS
jgi:multiple sugar transport system ATP-binding protein